MPLAYPGKQLDFLPDIRKNSVKMLNRVTISYNMIISKVLHFFSTLRDNVILCFIMLPWTSENINLVDLDLLPPKGLKTAIQK